MKKSFSLFLFAGLFGAFITQNSVANSNIQSGMTAKDDDQICPWNRYNKPNLKSNCSKDQKVDSDCTQTGSGAGKRGICKEFHNGALRCVARECPGDMVMPLVFENAIDASNGRNARILGYCYTKSQAEEKCEGQCAGGGDCKPKYVDHKEVNKNMLKPGYGITMTGGWAFSGCYCEECDVPQGTVCDTGKCKFVGDITIKCKVGGSTNISADVDIATADTREMIIEKVKKKYETEINKAIANCGSGQDDVVVSVGDESIKTSKKSNGVVAGVGKNANADSDKIRAAQTRLKEFFSKVDSDKSVWKNADGSFNGVRLASDLTAGVVLGTVGGVVSGVLIKKNQVEKGFDALNCTVGGQKIADWGDEFTVGMRR